MFDRITFDPNIMGGRACIRGMRIPVSVIVSQIAHGATWEEVLEGYPDLEREDIQQAIEYAAWLTHEEVRTGWPKQRMRFLADMGVSLRGPEMAAFIRPWRDPCPRWRAARIAEREIFQKALREERIVLTFDLDFGEIVRRVIDEASAWSCFGCANTRADFVIQRLKIVLEQSTEELAQGAVVLVEDGRHRVRRLPIGA